MSDEVFHFEPSHWRLGAVRVRQEVADDEDVVPAGGDNMDGPGWDGLVAVVILTWTGPPLAQVLASHVADALWQSFRKVFSQLRNLREEGGDDRLHLTIVQTGDEQLRIRIPGGLPDEAHLALIRDFDDLVRAEPTASAIRIVWDADKEKWARRASAS
ncbi:hypothetical protein ACQEVG_21435 [Streptomyces sp. CA-135486]|uniref:hypothetical protein n=1 Tax=Streptomyces sp. CA-135486 TaxID=3240049 RepID=UPI003D948D35